MLKKIIISAFYLNLGLMLGRLTGFIREIFLANSLGIGIDGDIAVFLVTFPDVLSSILMSGAFSSVLIPIFCSDKKQASSIFTNIFIIFIFLFILITFIGTFFSQNIISALAPGFNENIILKTDSFLKLIIWTVPITVLSGITTAYLHSKEKFLIPSMGTLIINSIIILSLIWALKFGNPLYYLSIAIFLASIIRIVTHLCCVDFKFEKSLMFVGVDKDFVKNFFIAIFSSSMLFIFPVFVRAIASNVAEGGFALANYSLKLIELPLALFILIVPTAIFPKLSESYTLDKNNYKKLSILGAQIVIAISVFISVGLGFFSNSYANLAFSKGALLAKDIKIISEMASTGLMFLSIFGLVNYYNFIFYSKKNYKVPFFISILGIIFFIFIYSLGIVGSDLNSCIWGMGASYLIMLFFQIFFAKIPIKHTLNKKFVLSLCFSLTILMYMCIFINKSTVVDLYKLFSVSVLSFILLSFVILINIPSLREYLMKYSRLLYKWN